MKKYLLAFLCLNLMGVQAQNYSWNEVLNTVSSDHTNGDDFGKSVAISGNYAVIGAPRESHDVNGGNQQDEAGSVYVYERGSNGNWTQKQKIVAPVRAMYDGFGTSVSISGDVILVGAPDEDQDQAEANTLANSGSAYLYERDANGVWNFIQKIVASDRSAGFRFGTSVAINNDYLIVGSPNYRHSSLLNNSGAAYIFEKDGSGVWVETQKITQSDKAANDQFGTKVSIHGDYVAVGMPRDQKDASNSNLMSFAGSVYIFERSLGGFWVQKQKLLPQHRQIGAMFGTSISINNSNVIIGARGETGVDYGDSRVENGGAAYIFNRNSAGTWSQVYRYVSFDRDSTDNLGYSVAISNDKAMVGAPIKFVDKNGDTTFAVGAVYALKYEGGSWAFDQKIMASNANVGRMFGSDLSMDANYALIGSSSVAENYESAYVFEFKCTPSTSVDTQVSCGPFTWIDGQTYTASNNTATFVINNGTCDSIITLNLTVYNVTNAVTVHFSDLTANQAGATYQWVDCGNGYTAIPGANSQTYTATADGSYAVIITNGTCVDTSTCYTITNASLKENQLINATYIYPNPSNGTFTVDSKYDMQLNVTDLTGRIIMNQNIKAGKNKISINERAGVYLLNFNSEFGKTIERILIK